MEQQLNNKNGGFGDIFLLLFSHAKFFFKNQQQPKNTQTNKQKRERERFGTEHTSTTSNL